MPSVGDYHPDPSTLGKPSYHSEGQFRGHTIRTELVEIQKADMGRKFSRVDRRPIDPPPAVGIFARRKIQVCLKAFQVLLRFFYVFNAGTAQETSQEVEDYDTVHTLGLICTVDLFPVPHSTPPVSILHQNISASDPPQTFYTSKSRNTDSSSRPFLSPDPTPIHYVDGLPIFESNKSTNCLVGATFVQPALVDYEERRSLFFVFPDLSVRTEGEYILRYRVFDLYSRQSSSDDLIMQAECYGGRFHIYATKDFPGLSQSTPLTKQLSRHGIRLNVRENERKRRHSNSDNINQDDDSDE